jgi:4-hydroxybutyrate CoA-transferase
VLDAGSVVTSPRGFVHHVVTEYGIATLKGKSIRERIDELVAIAHPDFRSELRSEARRLYRV